ncbi:hypothetical protein V8E53_001374 [Lactarius tabidus]
MISAFFYGMLMHSKILKRVLHNDASHLKICPSILSVNPLHQDADYPAIMRSERSKAVLGRELTSEENSTPGILVQCTYLTFRLIGRRVRYLLTILGQKYVRLQVFVHPTGPFTPVPVDVVTFGAVECSLILSDSPPLTASRLAQTVPAQTYVWGQDDG